jgi:hypothetical protein
MALKHLECDGLLNYHVNNMKTECCLAKDAKVSLNMFIRHTRSRD